MGRSDRKSRKRRETRSRGEKIREFVFGAGGLSGRGSERPEKPDPEPLYTLATEMAVIYEQIAQPKELLRHPLFRRGVKFLEHPGFSNRDLLLYGQGDNEVIAHMALAALSEREPDPDLRGELLGFMGRVSPWRRYFILEALLTHVPAGDALIGEVFILNRELHKAYQQILLTFAAYFLETRINEGESPTFAGRLESLDPEAISELEGFVDLGDSEMLAPLKREIEQWRAHFIDRKVLRECGHLWGESGRSSEGPFIEHPELASHVETIVRGLDQQPRRSTLLVGEPGCGKTAVMRAVGARLARQGWLIFEAGGPDLVAGQSYLGQFEERLKQVLDQLGGQGRALWFVPDFASLQMAGTHRYSRSGALDTVLPLVESGKIVMIGEARPAAMEKILRDHPRCQAAFELCRIAPLGESATLDLARSWIASISGEGQAPLIPEEVLQEAWLLAGQYLSDQAAPGSLLEFLKLAATRLSGSDRSLAVSDLIAALSKQTGLPEAILDDRQKLDTTDLRRFFNQRIMGQPEAVDCIVERIGIIKAGLSDPTRPQGVFLLAGPSGTGKTEIAKALATYLFGSDRRLLRLDMSEFQNPGDLERLAGGGQNGDDRQSLAARVRKQPFSVILLDEFEKAHPRVWDLFLQIFDDGRLTDGRGWTTDFRHTLILLTSNLGARLPDGTGVGFDKEQENFRAADVNRAVARAFRPEFLNRLDRVVVFRPLGRETMRAILVKELKDIQRRRGLRNRSWEVVWEDSATDFLLDRGFSATLGARPLKRAVERHLLTPLAETIVQGRFPDGDQFLYIHAAGDRLQVEFIDPNEPESDEGASEAPTSGEASSAPAADTAGLAAIALSPRGTADEVRCLQQALDARRHAVESELWRGAKELALSMMSVPDFWSSPERFTILGEVEYRERVENGLETARALLEKLQTSHPAGLDRFSRKVLSQCAERLLLLEQACLALDSRQPWEALVTLDIRTDAGPPTPADRRWLARLRDMYLSWGRRRKMQIKVLQDVPGLDTGNRPVVLAVSGFAAYSLLNPETGLHLWEEPSSRETRQHEHRQVMVRVFPQPEDLSGRPETDLLTAALNLLAEPMAGAPAIVRHYRQQPDPLVKDRSGGWRTGRLDRVLEGDFDLLALMNGAGLRSRKGEN